MRKVTLSLIGLCLALPVFAADQLSGTTAPTTRVIGTGAGGAVPVTGTFFQATQPVSGTFFQGTQPVSGSLTCNAGTGTFAVSGPLTDTQLRLTPLEVSGTFWQATQPVSGTFWQATQPVSGTFWQATQPVSGTVTATGPLTDTQLRLTPVPVSGSFYQATQPVSGTFWQATQPVSGTVIATGPVTDAELRATPVPISGTVTASGPLTDTQLRLTPVPVSGTVAATQSGTWTVQPGNTANTTAWKVDGSAVTQPVSGTVSANASQTGTWTVQPGNTANTTAWKVDGSAVTQPVSGPLTDTQIRLTPLPISGTVTASGPLTDTQLRLTPVPISGALTANQSVNVAQINGVTTTMGNGASGTGVQRVTIADDSTGLVKLATGANTIGALTANQSMNTAQINGVTPLMGNGASGTGAQRVTLADDSTGLVKLATGANTIGALTANQSTNLAQVAGATTATGNGTASGALRVSMASDSTGQVTIAAGSASIGSLAANQSTNIAQMNGVATTMGNGASGTGVQRVTIADDSTGLVKLATGANTIGALTANQSVNTAQINGVTPLMGNGATGTGALRVSIANDSTGIVALTTGAATIGALTANQTVDLNKVAGTAAVNGGLAGTLAIGGTGANNASITQNPDLVGIEALSSQPTAATTGNLRRLVGSLDGALYTRPGGPVTWTCSLAGLAASLTQCIAAPSAGLRYYITDMFVQTTTTTAGTYSVQMGTGSNCVTGTAALFPVNATSARWTAPISTSPTAAFSFGTPLAVTAASAICVIGTATNTINIQLTGYTAP